MDEANSYHVVIASDKVRRIFDSLKIRSWTASPIKYVYEIQDEPKYVGYITMDRLPKFKTITGEFKFEAERLHRYGYKAKPGKFLKKYDPKLSDEIISTFSTKYGVDPNKSQLKDFYITTDVEHGYHEDNYKWDRSLGGTLWSSCMREDRYNSLMGFYVKIGVQLLVLDQGDGICGRALLWEGLKVKGSGLTINFMDRIYTIDVNDEELFKLWAEKHNYWYKKHQSWNFKQMFMSPTHEVHAPLTMTYGVPELDSGSSYPYLDTMSYYIVEQGILSNSPETDNETRWEFTGTDGSYDLIEVPKVYSEYLGRSIVESDAVWSERYDSSLLLEDSVKDIHDDWIPKENTITLLNGELAEVNDPVIGLSKRLGGYIMIDAPDVTFSEADDDWVLLNDTIEDFFGHWILEENSIKLYIKEYDCTITLHKNELKSSNIMKAVTQKLANEQEIKDKQLYLTSKEESND